MYIKGDKVKGLSRHKIIPYAGVLVFLIFLFLCLTNQAQASVMPEYERLTPVKAKLTAPTALALDSAGALYVVESSKNRLLKFSQSGNYLGMLSGLEKPISVAVDSSGRIYVGNDDKGSVEVYSPEFEFLYRLGGGEGEFDKPGAIVIDSADSIYVADSEGDVIKVYNPDGSLRFTFGESGSADGQFNFPTSIAIDESQGEIVVTDLQVIDTIYGLTETARVQVFDMNGIFKRSFGEFGQGEGKLFKPMGVTVDGESRIYIADSYQNVVQVFDNQGIYLGTIYDLKSPMRTPLDVAIWANKLYIASLRGARVEVYGIDTYVQMEVVPLNLTFEAQEKGSSPEPQDVEIRNKGTGILNWTAIANEDWISLSEASGSIEPSWTSIISVAIDHSGLTQGTYTGSVEITADTGATEIVKVDLTVTPPPPELSVTPSSLVFVSEDGIVPQPQALSIQNTGGGELNWTAEAGSSWILLDKGSGIAPDTLNVSVNISSLKEGVYNSSITIRAEGAIGSPLTVPVSLEVIVHKGTIEVTTNLEQATFTLNGPASYTGSGMSWSVTDAPVGTYTIIFGDVTGYKKPSSESKTLTEGGTIAFRGIYEEETSEGETSKTVRHIIAGAGPRDRNTALVKVFNVDGTPTTVEFIANTYGYGVNVAAGDIDGDGTYEIITAPGPGANNPAEIKIFNRQGGRLSNLDITPYEYKYGANIAVGDIDGDGRYEVITGAGQGPDNPAHVKIYVYDPSEQRLKDSGINLFAYNSVFGVRIAAGDIDCDGEDEIITAPGSGEGNIGDIKIWEVDTTGGIGQWSITMSKQFIAQFRYDYSVTIATGDLNGDGYDEIITGAGPHPKASDEIKVFNRDGELIVEFRANIARRYGVNVSTGDIDADGSAEIIAGAGAGKTNRAIIKVFNASGVEQLRFKAMNTKYGVNVGFGVGQ
jgi:hypothetical protein